MGAPDGAPGAELNHPVRDFQAQSLCRQMLRSPPLPRTLSCWAGPAPLLLGANAPGPCP